VSDFQVALMECPQRPLFYASLGLRVLPLHYPFPDSAGPVRCSCREESCTHVGKHPLGRLVPHGIHDATSDPNVIRRWWVTEPNANVGIALDPDKVVIDVDPRHGGDASIRDFEARHGRLPASPMVGTAGGGRHLWMRQIAGAQLATAIGLLPGIDILTDGSLAVAPPSVGGSGRCYEWLGPGMDSGQCAASAGT
jgi:Bifunctional DNA primase/polymerase, N-terminal